MSPIGNPQNLLIAVGGGLENPFATFLRHLALPTLLSLALAYALLRLLLRGSFHARPLVHTPQTTCDPQLAALARLALVIVLVLVLAKVSLVVAGLGLSFPLSVIALAAAAPVLALSPRRWQLLRRIDWHTLVFFAAMFVLMQSVWDAGVIQDWLRGLHLDLRGVPAIFGVGVLLSQLISNVPLVALYLPLLQQAGAGTESLVALAAASTIAGNLLILGAASNVIIIESAQRRGTRLSFLDFARVGVPLTLLQVAVYWVFLDWR
jgi:Na+/H+ antiporter NhaD/arsenite permease-like protein